jgi:hypothetical protein
MNLDSIKEKVSSIFESTPPEVGTGFGFKIKDGKLTDEVGFTFIVPRKKPISELSEDELFPSTIEHDGIEYTTDVIEIPEISPLGLYCFGTDPIAPADPQVSPNCFSWATIPPINRNYTRPLKGGVSMGVTTSAGAGTLGFIAVDIATQGLVGVTNNHVAIASSNDPFFTGERNLGSTAIFNESFPTNFVQQPGVLDASGPNLPQYQIGRTLRYQPLVSPINGTNTVDGALISLSQYDSAGSLVIDINESWKQVGLTGITTPPQFATLLELNSMIGGGFSSSNTEIISAGRTTGAKEGPCSDRLHLLTCTVSVGPYPLQGAGSVVSFVDQMSVVRVSSGNTLCTYPSCRGDSGSAMFAEFGGQWKIIGILFAGGAGDPTTGALPPGAGFPTYYNGCSSPSPYPSIFTFVNKITNVETALGIQAWDGTVKPFVDPNSIEYVSVCGGNFTKTLTCSGDTYWQVGLTNSLITPCNP